MYFAIIEDGVVVNTIISESKQVAEDILGVPCIQYTDENLAVIGGTYDGSVFIDPKPFPSWVLNSQKKWDPPIAYPNDNKNYYWNEEETSWTEVAGVVTRDTPIEEE
jgi:hypothetical protein